MDAEYEEARQRLAMALTIYDGPQNFAVVLRRDLWVVLEHTRPAMMRGTAREARAATA